MSEDVRVTKDEVDRKQFDALELKDRDPNKVYRWAKKRDINMARHKFHGYDPVDRNTDKVRSVCDDSTRMKKGEDVSTSIEFADMILISTPRENHERLLRERQDKIQRQTRGVTGEYKRAVGQIAGPGIAYEEHQDNPAMRGMSDKAFEKLQEEEAHERKRR